LNDCWTYGKRKKGKVVVLLQVLEDFFIRLIILTVRIRFRSKGVRRMKKRTVFVCVLCSLLLTSMAAALLVRPGASIESPYVYGPNLLTNPGFEYGLTGWTTFGAAVFSADSSTFVSGRYSCKGVDTSGESLDRLYQNVTGIASPGNQYQISGWIKTSNAYGWIVIGLDYVAADGSMSEADYVMQIGPASETSYTQDWTLFSSEVFTLPPMPSDAQALWFWVGFYYATGTAWWDNLSLVLVTSPAPVPPGTNVAVTLNDYISLVFEEVTSAGYATATATSSYPAPPPSPAPSVAAPTATSTAQVLSGSPFIGPVWDVTTTATFSGQVTVKIVFPDTAYPTQMLQTDIVPGDVNRDGVVNCTDLLLILKALWSTPGSPRWNPNCDVNHDGKINLLDLLIALKNFGKTSQWTDITSWIDWTNHVVYGRTDHFSLIGIH
jgi:hypothetical protein